MRFGICNKIFPIDIRTLEIYAKAGIDYVEPPVVQTMTMTPVELRAFTARQKDMSIPCETMNLFFPGDIKLTGPDADATRAVDHACRALDCAATLGAKIIVLGSGGARRVPDGFSMDEGWAQLTRILRRLGEVASQRGITIALEPLRSAETNILNTLSETARMVREIDHKSIRLLADHYHMSAAKETGTTLSGTGDILVHTHISSPDRFFPLPDDGHDYTSFFSGLRDVGYDGRMSIEANLRDLEKELPLTVALLKRLAG